MSKNMAAYWSILFVSLILKFSYGDIYMHNPRGSNNRLDEKGRGRNNGNRMFDSQNNERGGYNVGSLYYYDGSVLPIEWTNQHSCGGPNNHCELILQYMCDDNVRDGATTTTIPDNPAQCENYNCNTDFRYGMNEDYNYYTDCKLRQRNEGLFLADQKPKGKTAIYTRQNPGGTRRGYECPEERDYYPYWHPSPWRDIAIMTNDVSRCEYYQAESENVKPRYHCVVPYMEKMQNAKARNFVIPNNEEECKAWRWPAGDEDGLKAEWKMEPSHDLPPPVCQETEFSRDNHLGNGKSGYPNLFNWTIPASAIGDNCALRIRYNISTSEFDGWDGSTNSSLNEVQNNQGSLLDLSSKYGLPNLEEARDRGYVLENNPQLDIFGSKLKLQLAINTAQFGRTFQDRSHTMSIKKAPEEYAGQRIFNLNIRGKRGNIVQVYPAVEYDFVPNTLQLSVDDYVHIQWTGSNTNPNNNDGQGLQGTDRSNMVLQAERAYSENSATYWADTNKYGHWGRSYPLHLDEATLIGLSREDRTTLALTSPGQFRGELSELDDAGTYFDLGARKVTEAGTAHYMCTRNNNFSNRSQKGKIIANKYGVSQALIGSMGGTIALPNQKATVTVNEKVLSELTYISMEEWPADIGHQKILDAGQEMTAGREYASDFIVIRPEEAVSSDDQAMNVSMKLHSAAGTGVEVYRTSSAHFSSWQKVDATITDGTANFAVSSGGVYVARKQANAGVIIGAVIACVAVLALIVISVVYFRRHPEKCQSINKRLRNAKRSTQSAI